MPDDLKSLSILDWRFLWLPLVSFGIWALVTAWVIWNWHWIFSRGLS